MPPFEYLLLRVLLLSGCLVMNFFIAAVGSIVGLTQRIALDEMLQRLEEGGALWVKRKQNSKIITPNIIAGGNVSP